MNNYDFHTLNDKEFENLVRDLLNAEFNLGLQSFKVGKDKGIDLRYSTVSNKNEIIVQVKHYVGSGFHQLKNTLKTVEFEKVKKLNPNRYIVATSLPLSAPQKDEIKEIFEPYILTSNDIFGKDDLNRFLVKHDEIEKNYFKLWFSSVNILTRILNNAIEGRTLYHLESIQKKIPYYVITKKFDDANKILNKEKLLLITGQPGIGKTTLGDIIFFNKAKDGFKVHKIYSFKEAEDIISPSNKVKQLFYFDDFLGESYLEIISANRLKTELTSFIDRIKNTPNKYLILTTRTVILNLAVEKYEKLNRTKISNKQFELKLEDYTKYEKALILYNKLFFNKLPVLFCESVIKKRFYMDIITHTNYTPRIIEFITDKSKVEKLNVNQYHDFISSNLTNPDEIWRYSFNNQISYPDRCLLITLFSFPHGVYENELANAFESRMIYEKTNHNQIINPGQFQESIRILLNGFITSTIYDIENPKRVFSFINPSLRDFFINYLNENIAEKSIVFKSLIYFGQLDSLLTDYSVNKLSIKLQETIYKKIFENDIKVQESNMNHKDRNYYLIKKIESLIKYCPDIDADKLILASFKEIDFNNIEDNIYSIEFIFIAAKKYSNTFLYIKSNFIDIIDNYIKAINDTDTAEGIPRLFFAYDCNYTEYINDVSKIDKMKNIIKHLISNKEEEMKSDKAGEVRDFNDVENIYDELNNTKNGLISGLLLHNPFELNLNIDFDYWNDQINDNIENDSIQDEYADLHKDEFYFELSENEVIDDLFSKHI